MQVCCCFTVVFDETAVPVTNSPGACFLEVVCKEGAHLRDRCTAVVVIDNFTDIDVVAAAVLLLVTTLFLYLVAIIVPDGMFDASFAVLIAMSFDFDQTRQKTRHKKLTNGNKD